MEKIDYSDINKFLVSIGLVLIGFSILVPYFFLKEDFSIYINQSELLKYDEEIRRIITQKQKLVFNIQSKITCISICLFSIGLITMIIGLFRWFKRQSKIDEKFDKEISKLDLEIKSLTPEEKIEKINNEVDEIQIAEQLESNSNPNLSKESKEILYQNYANTELAFYNKFKLFNSPNFEVFTEQKLGNRFYIDVILKSKSLKFKDRLIEIKYYKNPIPITSLLLTLTQLQTYVKSYKKSTKRNVVPVLLIVYNAEKINPEKIKIYESAIKHFNTNQNDLINLKVEFIKESEIKDFDIKRVLKK